MNSFGEREVEKESNFFGEHTKSLRGESGRQNNKDPGKTRGDFFSFFI